MYMGAIKQKKYFRSALIKHCANILDPSFCLLVQSNVEHISGICCDVHSQTPLSTSVMLSFFLCLFLTFSNLPSFLVTPCLFYPTGTYELN